jgi:hypothetical protein
MKLKYQCDCRDINWELVPEILKSVGMSFHDAEVHRKTFTASASVVFVYDDQKLIGFGRAISDGLIQAAIIRCGCCACLAGTGNRETNHRKDCGLTTGM